MEFLNYFHLLYLVRIGSILFLGLPLVWFLSRFLRSTIEKRTSSHIAMLISNIVFYTGLIIIITTLMQEFGYNISALLGAAGVLGIAVGFAAKTTVSNIISGIFLLIEHPFVIGDRILCSNVIGVVEAIDLMSVKLRTSSGQMVRIPNETLVSNVITNISYFPKRRLIFRAEVPPTQSLEPIMEFFNKVIEQDSMILKDPVPVVAVRAYGQFAVDIMLRFWTKRADAQSIYIRLHEKFDEYAKEHGVWIGLIQEI